jgi:ADP-heptose:LPS heptosyltransferase
MQTIIGVESAFSFGDALFNVPLIKAIADHHRCKIVVATKSQYADAFMNLGFIEAIHTIENLGEGMAYFQQNPVYWKSYQITQFTKFYDYKETDPEHSLLDTPSYIGRDLGIPAFNPKPIFMPTLRELANTEANIFGSGPFIAIESEARSGQSWADSNAIQIIIEAHKDTHKILWLSLTPAPEGTIDLKQLTRREVIMCLRHVDIFYSVGSGFFCAALALLEMYQPKKIRCLWIDNLYKYKDKLTQNKWHKDIEWIDNHQELSQIVRI